MHQVPVSKQTKHQLSNLMMIDLFDKAEICCLSRESYLGHLAMTMIKEGGFVSESFVFPLYRIESTPLFQSRQLPNGQTFTSYDGLHGSLLSGSHLEWIRIVHLLKNKLTEVKFSDKQVINVHRLSEEPKNYYPINMVSSTNPILSQNQFMIDICPYLN